MRSAAENGVTLSFISVYDEGGTVWEGKRTYATMDEALQDADAGIAASGGTSASSRYSFLVKILSVAVFGTNFLPSFLSSSIVTFPKEVFFKSPLSEIYGGVASGSLPPFEISCLHVHDSIQYTGDMTNSTNNNWYQDLPGEGRRLAQVLALMLLAGLVASVGAFAYSYMISGWTTAKSAVSSRQISVTGEGKISVRPDTAVFTASVITQAKKISDAQTQNSSRANAIIDFLKTRGVGEKDIKTIGYNISPQYQYFNSPPCTAFPCPPQKPPEITSYEIRNAIEIKVRELASADTLIEGVTNAGANEVGSIAFRVDDEDTAKAQAHAQAIADAQVKARQIAVALGVRLGRITGYYDQTDAPQPGYEGANASPMMLKAASQAPPVQPGEQEIKASVGVTYEFR